MLIIFLAGCTIKVEPIAKPKPVVKYVHHSAHHHKKHPHATPTPHGMIAPDDHTKLIEHPTPQP